MFQSYIAYMHQHGNQQPTADLAVSHATAVAVNPLTLPEVDSLIPATFAVPPTANGLQGVALTLLNGGLLKEWEGDLRHTVAKVFSDCAVRQLPTSLSQFQLMVIEDTEDADGMDTDFGSKQSYCNKHSLPHDTKVSAIVVTFNNEELVHRVIGPTIQRLENHRPGLGQTVLYWLHEGFEKSARATDPVNGIDWAEYTYWGGNTDESERMEEELDWARTSHAEKQAKLPKKERKPFDEAVAKQNIEIFKKSDYDEHIPVWAGTGFKKKPRLSLKKLKRLRRGKHRAIVAAVLELAGMLQTLPTRSRDINDVGDFENTRWDMSPYLLRWHCTGNRESQDALAQIYDDYMTDCMNAGEDLMDVNSMFAWHDDKSLLDAVRRFEMFCRIIHLSEALLIKISPKPLP